jgi:hypothetical protein
LLAALPVEISDTAKKVGKNLLLRGTFLAASIVVLLYGFSSVAAYQLATGKRVSPIADAWAASLLHLISVILSFTYLRLDKRCRDEATNLVETTLKVVFHPMTPSVSDKKSADLQVSLRKNRLLALNTHTTSRMPSLEEGRDNGMDSPFCIYTPIF